MEPSPDRPPSRLGAWVARVSGHPLLVAFGCLAAAAGLLWLAASTLTINTSTEDMLSEELPWRQNNRAVDRAFPQQVDTLTIAVEGPDALAAQSGASRLAEALRARPEIFQSVRRPEGGPFFRRNGLLYLSTAELQETSERLAAAQPLLTALQRDPSLRGLADLVVEALGAQSGVGTAEVARLLTRMAATAEALKRDPTARLSWSALLSGEAETAEDRRRFLIAKPVIDFATLEPLSAAVAAVEAAADDLGLTAAQGYRVRMTGQALMLQDELVSVRTGISVVALISAALVAVVLFAGLGTWRLVLPVLVTLAAGLAWTAGFAALAVGELNLISVAFAVLFIGLSVDFGIHYVLRVQESRSGGLDQAAALRDAAARIGRPLALCALTSALAFFAFFPTAYRGLSELGLIAGVGMFIALFLNLTLLPALMKLTSAQGSGPRPGIFARAGAGLQRWAAGRARLLAGLGAVLAVAAAFTLPQTRFDDDPLNLRDPDSPSVAALLDMLEDPRVSPYSAQVLVTPPARDSGAVEARLEALPQVDRAITLEDFVPEDQAAKLQIIDQTAVLLAPLFAASPPRAAPDDTARAAALDRLKAALAEAPQALAQEAARLETVLQNLEGITLAQLERAWLEGFEPALARLLDALEAGEVTVDDLPEDLRRRYAAPDGSRLIEVVPAADLRDPGARERFVAAVQAEVPNVSGVPVTIVEAGQAVVTAFAQASVLALVAIALLLLAVLRSPLDTLLVLLPLLLAALLTVAVGAIFNLPFNFANVIVLPLLLGLGVDSGIHYVMRARERRRARAEAAQDGAEQDGAAQDGAAQDGAAQDGAAGLDAGAVVNSTPRAIFLSAVTTLSSFGALSLSAHPGTASMGQLLTIAIVITLACVLAFLPALLALAGRLPRG